MTRPAGLFTDLYELAMAQLYFERGQNDEAVFELAARSLPDGWGFLVAAGLDDLLERIESLRFSEDDLAYLAEQPQFGGGFIERLRRFRFSGEVWAPPEGTVVLPHEPLLQIAAPLPEGQLIETLALNRISAATLIASKAARSVLAAAGAPLYEFGGRRAHGEDAALIAARSAYIAGYQATSSVEAGRRYGIPVVGTMAHSFVLVHDDEAAAFRSFVERYPGTTLLVDTYDTRRGIERVIALAGELGPEAIGAIRLDSGDLAQLSAEARARFDAAGLGRLRIIASSGLEERQIAALVAARAPIDAFACGTAIVTSSDAPALETAYKLVAYGGRDRAKRSPGKPSLPARKQVWRRESGGAGGQIDGDIRADRVQRFEAPAPRGMRPLLRRVMADGRRTAAHEQDALTAIRSRAAAQIAALPEPLRSLDADACEPTVAL